MSFRCCDLDDQLNKYEKAIFMVLCFCICKDAFKKEKLIKQSGWKAFEN